MPNNYTTTNGSFLFEFAPLKVNFHQAVWVDLLQLGTKLMFFFCAHCYVFLIDDSTIDHVLTPVPLSWSSTASQSTMTARTWTKSTSRTPSHCDSLCSRPKWAATDAERTAASQTWVKETVSCEVVDILPPFQEGHVGLGGHCHRLLRAATTNPRHSFFSSI